jgi:hypothetical protein
MNAHMMLGSFTLAGAMTMRSGGTLIVESIGTWGLVLILLALCGTVVWAPVRLARADEDAQLRVFLMLIILTFALRLVSQAGTIGGVSDRTACLAPCSVFGAVQAAYSEADGAHCICRQP